MGSPGQRRKARAADAEPRFWARRSVERVRLKGRARQSIGKNPVPCRLSLHEKNFLKGVLVQLVKPMSNHPLYLRMGVTCNPWKSGIGSTDLDLVSLRKINMKAAPIPNVSGRDLMPCESRPL